MLKRYLYFLWQKYIEPVDPINWWLKQAVKSFIATLISISLLTYLKFPQGKWFIFATIMVMQMELGDSLKTRHLIQLLGGVILAVCLFASSIIGQYHLAFLLFMALLAFITFYLFQYGPNIIKPALLTLTITLMSGSFPTSMIDSWHRFTVSIIATLLAFIISTTIWPFKPYKILHQHLQQNFLNIARYIKFVIDDSLRGNFHRLHRYEKKAKILTIIQYCTKLSAKYHGKFPKEILYLQSQLFVQAVALSDLLNKPNSEYTLDMIMDNMSRLKTTLVATIKAPNQQRLKQLQVQTAQLNDLTTIKYYKSFITNDINNICYMLNKIHNTLDIINEMQIANSP